MELAIAGGRFPSEVIVVDSLMTEEWIPEKTPVQHRSGERATDPGQWEVLNRSSEQEN